MALDKIDRWLAAIEYLVIAGAVLLALVLGTMQVVLRYAFNTGFPWSEEAFTLSTIIAMLFAGSRAVREDRHVRVELVFLLVSSKAGRVLRLIAHAATLLLCAYYAYGGLLYVQFTYEIDSVSPDSETPEWIIFTLVPLTMALFVLRYVIRIVRLLRDEDVDVTRGVRGDGLPQAEARS
ncbi:MAG: TRAP transporter small permease [Bradyrhizobiaceae bacterium]|nr:TRAP transporter small permease [Bradyrhizobiaceae bacterium]